MTNDGGPAVDTSREAVERLAHDCDDHAQWLRDRTPEGGTAGLAEVYDRIAATLLALLSERDAATAERDRFRHALDRAEQQIDYGQIDSGLRIMRAALAPEPQP